MTDTRATGAPPPVTKPTGAPGETSHWYHGHGFHIGAGLFVSLLYTAVVAFVVPIMSAMNLDAETNLQILVGWGFLSIVYSWRKGKRITALIDRKMVLMPRTARWELFWLLLPYLAFLFDIALRLGTSIQYSNYQWIIIWGTAFVTTITLDTNSSFILDLLKAAPIAERAETDLRR